MRQDLAAHARIPVLADMIGDRRRRVIGCLSDKEALNLVRHIDETLDSHCPLSARPSA